MIATANAICAARAGESGTDAVDKASTGRQCRAASRSTLIPKGNASATTSKLREMARIASSTEGTPLKKTAFVSKPPTVAHRRLRLDMEQTPATDVKTGLKVSAIR